MSDTDRAVLKLLNDWCDDVRVNYPLRSKATTKLLEEIKELYG